MFKKIGKFFKGVGQEFKKIIWPTPSAVFKQSVLVFVAVIVLGLIVCFFDMGITALIGLMH